MQQTQNMNITKMNIKLIKGASGIKTTLNNKQAKMQKTQIIKQTGSYKPHVLFASKGPFSKKKSLEEICISDVQNQKDLTNKIKDINPRTSIILMKNTPDTT